MASFSDSAWFAGFADGEAHLGITPRNRSSRGGGYGPVFAIGLRADDLALLEALHGEFGGSICVHQSPSGENVGQKPQVRWNVSSKASLLALVRYFDEFPLRSKKAREYALWRRGVCAYARAGYRSEELAALYGPLMAIRRFEAVVEEATVIEPPQLKLVKEG